MRHERWLYLFLFAACVCAIAPARAGDDPRWTVRVSAGPARTGGTRPEWLRQSPTIATFVEDSRAFAASPGTDTGFGASVEYHAMTWFAVRGNYARWRPGFTWIERHEGMSRARSFAFTTWNASIDLLAHARLARVELSAGPSFGVQDASSFVINGHRVAFDRDTAWGAVAGLDVPMAPRWMLGVNARWRSASLDFTVPPEAFVEQRTATVRLRGWALEGTVGYRF